ncbi:hypothetical protein EBL_c04460 [Shimwellia blattae DSM 4481 = NBRC 105725]|uniref:Uncharacterized protein n=1 Tax=Shimwellia blattae (strain ATCC 29907 / DSM 4481 / JCM 1650 / NBRC 105725 / CDC 9005-74) TaxID=630626 RepID=I2B4W8_SHIBC|nr:hypothetical protein EBL_c04460 [Shimwellia blattae DSM 4481 = NBRC 105725]
MIVHDRTRLTGQLQLFKKPRSGGVLLFVKNPLHSLFFCHSSDDVLRDFCRLFLSGREGLARNH